MRDKVNFYAEFNRFEFNVFLLLDQLPYQSYRALLFIHNWRENKWIYTFPKVIVAVWLEFQFLNHYAIATPIHNNIEILKLLLISSTSIAYGF